MFSNLQQLVGGYPWYEIVLEMAVIGAVIYLIFRFLRGTRGAGVIKGFFIILVVLTLLIKVLGQSGAFERLEYIYTTFLGLVAILLLVVFQPELRQAMIRLGRTRFMGGTHRRETSHVVESITKAVHVLSKSQFGALMAIERNVGLRGIEATGEKLDAVLSSRLLESIFWPNNPLHDLGVVIRGERVVAANVQFPLAEEGVVEHNLGSRHRAAIGLSMDSDCIVVIVSEETGAISIAAHGNLDREIPHDEFEQVLTRYLMGPRGDLSAPLADEPSGEQTESQSTATSDLAAKTARTSPPSTTASPLAKESRA